MDDNFFCVVRTMLAANRNVSLFLARCLIDRGIATPPEAGTGTDQERSLATKGTIMFKINNTRIDIGDS